MIIEYKADCWDYLHKYTGRHMYFDKTKVKYTHNLNLLHVNFRHQWKGNLNAVWMIQYIS